MKHRIKSLLVLALVATAAGLVGIVSVRTGARNAEAHRLAQERAALAADAQKLAEKLAVAERQRDALRTELAKLSAPPLRAPAPRPVATPRPPPDPEQTAKEMRQQRARLALSYGAFYRAAGLDAETVGRFEQLLVERDAEERDLWLISREMPPGEKFEVVSVPLGAGTSGEAKVDPAIAATRRQQLAQFEAKQLAVLGEENYRRLQEYRRGEVRRRVIGQLVSDTTLTPAPLTPAQTQQLDVVWRGIDLGGKPVLNFADWTEILARAETVLSAPQMAALKAQADKAERAAARNVLTEMVGRYVE